MDFLMGGYSAELSLARLDEGDGSIEVVASVETPENASFLAYVPQFSVVYATVESGYGDGESGKIAAYRVRRDSLAPMGTVESCGAGPCHIGVDAEAGLLTAANYGGESFVAIRLTRDGELGEQVACGRHEGSSVMESRQREPHPHATTFSPDGRFLYVCDLGTDKVMRYSTESLAAGRTEGAVAAEPQPGSGPRHLDFSPDGRFAYLVNELSSTVVAYAFAPQDGILSEIQVVPMLPDGFDGESWAAEIQVHPKGDFVYASNRGHDTIAVFKRGGSDGTLERAGYFDVVGRTPRHFQIDPSGSWCLVANQQSDQVVSFRIDPKSGKGTWSGKGVRAKAPSCAIFCRPE